MLMLVYIATGNKSKLKGFEQLFSWINPKIQVELVPEYVDVSESGKTLADNALLKVLPYKGKYLVPVFSSDSGLFFDKSVLEIQDPVKVKRNALEGKDEQELTQEEIAERMFLYYKNLAKKYGGKIDCQMKGVFTMLLPDGTIFQEETETDYELIDRTTSTYDLYHPLESLRISKVIGKFMDELNENERRMDKKSLLIGLERLLKKVE